MALSVVNVMVELAKHGHAIICTIHQPSSEIYSKFDRVMFLAGGRLAYFGPPKESVDFFASCGFPCPRHYNPADMIIENLAVEPHNEAGSRKRIKTICDRFVESDQAQKIAGFVERCRQDVYGDYGADFGGPQMAGCFTQVRFTRLCFICAYNFRWACC